MEISLRVVEEALLAPGVERDGGRDRFGALGLGRRRDVDDWLVDETPGAA